MMDSSREDRGGFLGLQAIPVAARKINSLDARASTAMDYFRKAFLRSGMFDAYTHILQLLDQIKIVNINYKQHNNFARYIVA